MEEEVVLNILSAKKIFLTFQSTKTNRSVYGSLEAEKVFPDHPEDYANL